jgi:cyclophilin family peptidyl-prolyl cis-trans isomerase
MSASRRPSRRVPSKGRSLRRDPRPAPFEDDTAEISDLGATAVGGPDGPRPGSRAANRAAKRAVTGVRPKTRMRGGSGGRRSGSSNTALIGLAIGAVVIAAAVILIGNPFGNPAASPSASPGTPLVVGDGSCPTSQPAALPAGETRTVTISTPMGDIVIKVEGALSPIAAGNFVALAECHFYDGSVFHRTASLTSGTPFVIQGGQPKDGMGEIPYSIQDESVTATYHRGTVAMARTDSPNSQTSQFFIVMDDEASSVLTSYNTYAIFGEVIAGMDVADAIYAAAGGVETPTDPVPMTSVTVSAGPAATATPAPTAAPSAPPATPVDSTAPTTAP